MPRLATPALLLVALALAGCSQQAPTPATTPDAPITAPMKTVSTPTPTPTQAQSIVVDLDGLVVHRGAQTETIAFEDPEALLALIEDLTDEPRQGEDFEDPWGTGDVWGTAYRWNGVTVSVPTDGPAHITITVPTIGTTPIATAAGVAVGASRDQVIAAGAWEDRDADGDGIPECYGDDERDVEGTQSLQRPGEVGREYLRIALTADDVTSLESPANDYSDI